MSNIRHAFDHGKAFIPFITCGDPDLETTAKIIREIASNGADLIELGIPFSDPTAEGPVIMNANDRALNSGTTTEKIFDLVRVIRQDITTPMVFMTYTNVIFSYGADRFMKRSRDLDIDGIILPDLPYEEKEEFDSICIEHDIDLISMIAPTSNERISKIAKNARGFLYIVSSLGVTGVRSDIKTDIDKIVNNARNHTKIPCAVGFGISTPEQARNISSVSDGVIVGSAIVKIIEQFGKSAPLHVGSFVKNIKMSIAI